MLHRDRDEAAGPFKLIVAAPFGAHHEQAVCLQICSCVQSLLCFWYRSDATIGKTLPLAGPKAWTNDEVIALCEKLSGGLEAEVRNVPVWILKGTRNLLKGLQWAADASDRLVSG